MKKIDTLFHGTIRMDYLISILENGFYSSYANEEISNRKMKILMVSFSNVALLESKNQVSYGKYFIGLKRDWAIEKGVQPVAYTYKGSKIENSIWDMIRESAIGQASYILKELKTKDIPVEFEGSFLMD